MKKISVLLVSVILLAVFTACSGAKKSETPAEETIKVEDVVATPEPQVEAIAVDPAVALKNFQDFAKEYAEAYNNSKKDPKKYTELAAKSTKIVTEIANLQDQFNKKQLEEFQKAVEVIAKINRGGQ